jgi:phosphopantothenoylcysteine decarboxylase/phosphopantothenate--cysteine ligase
LVTNLKDKRVLITAGPTWVKIDGVRVISNIATGSTGILLAKVLSQLGAKVTLLLGPTGICNVNKKIRLLRFSYFNELKDLLEKELRSKKYDLAIHTAAVSDYKPRFTQSGKIKSGLKELAIKLTPTFKIISIFKKIQPLICLVGFKFEPNTTRKKLAREAQQLIINTQADLVVANTLKNNRYIAYLVTGNRISAPIFSKEGTAKNLIRALINNAKGRVEMNPALLKKVN